MTRKSGLYYMQLIRLLTRRESKIAIALCFFFLSAAFAEECITLWEMDQSMVFAAPIGWIGNINTVKGYVMQIFYFFGICLIAALAFSDTFLEDSQNHSLVAILGRNTWKTYWHSGLLMSFIGGFFVIFIPLFISQLFSFIVFPIFDGTLKGSFGIGAWEFPSLLTNDAYVFPWLTLNHPYLSNLLFIASSSLFAGFNAAISYLLSLLGIRKKLLVLGIPALFWVVYNAVITFISPGLVFQVYLYPDYSIFKEPWFFFVLPLSLLLIILAGCLAVQKRKKEAVLI